MDDNKFWIDLWKIVGGVLSLGIVVILVASLTKDRHIAKAISEGVNPIAAHCAFVHSRKDRCAIAVMAGEDAPWTREKGN